MAISHKPSAIRLLLVDDDDQVRSALSRYLSRAGYDVVQAEGGEAALRRLESDGPFEAVLSDIRMPGMTGVELLPKIIAHDPDMAIIMLTAVGEPASAIECLRLGAADYLIKPIEMEELKHSLNYALRKRELEVERRELEQWLAREVAVKTQELEEQAQRVELLSLSILTALVDAIDPGRSGRNHSIRVANLSAHVAAGMGLGPDQVEAVRLAARLHDLGRIGSLRGDGSTAGESAPVVAARILEPLQHHAEMVEIVRRQSDSWQQIPVGARILAAVNLYDELTEEPLGDAPVESPPQAIAALKSQAGKTLDPAVVEALERVVKQRA